MNIEQGVQNIEGQKLHHSHYSLFDIRYLNSKMIFCQLLAEAKQEF